MLEAAVHPPKEPSMSRPSTDLPISHSPAWVVQCWVSFLISLTVTGFGVFFLPVDGWIKAFMSMGMLFCLGSAVSLTKTLRDLHEASRFAARIDEARVHKLIAEHDPLRPAV
jgi:hypothetical protein